MGHIPQNQRFNRQVGTQLKRRDADQKYGGPVQFVPVAAGVLINAAAKIPQYTVQKRYHSIDDRIHRHQIDPLFRTDFPFSSSGPLNLKIA